MAEDCIIGFKFFDREDSRAIDEAVDLASSELFSKAGFDPKFDHLGVRSEMDAKILGAADGAPDDLAGFDFTEGFDFAF